MKNNRVLEEFIELTGISSPSLGERQMADILKYRLAELGFTVYEDKAGEELGGSSGNVIGRLKGNKGTPVMLCAHMDRVANGDGIKHVIEDGKIMSDGTTILAADDVSGIVAILGGLRLLNESKLEHCDIEVVFTVSEEKLLQGSKSLDYGLLNAKHSYCFDSSGRIGRIVNAAPSQAQIYVDVYGKSAHAGQAPEKGINALKAAGKILADVQDGRLDFETTANWGVIKAGNATNVVCDHAEILAEARSRDRKKLDKYIEYVKKYCADVIAGTGAKASVRVEYIYDAFLVSEEDELLTTLCAVMKKNDITPVIEQGGGGMDANRFNNRGIKSVGVATGYFNNHSTKEELYIEDLNQATKIVFDLICAYSKNTPEKKEKPAGACPICGFITPFNPAEEGFCCPVCGAPSGQVKK